MSKVADSGPLANPEKRTWAGGLIQNALALMASSGGSALLGVVFWGTAAHLASPSDVGRASAEIAAMVLLANLSQLSFTTIFTRFLPVTGNRTRRFVKRAYAMCILVALVVAIGYLALGFGSSYIPSGLGWRTLFVVSVALWTIFVLQDSVLTGLRATRWVPVENILFSAAKIALLPVFYVVTAKQGIFLAWTLPVIFAIGAVSWYLFRRRMPQHELLHPSSENHPSRRELLRLAVGQYAISLVSTFSSPLVALIVIQQLGATAEAHYYVPALITTGGVALLLWNLVTSFLVEASTDPGEILAHVKLTIRATVIVLLPCVTIGVIFAPEILRLFGPTYAEYGTTLLRLLLLALPGTAAAAFYSSMAWLDKRVWMIALFDLLSTLFYFALILLLIKHLGIVAIGVASLALSIVEATVFLPFSVRRYRRIARGEGLSAGPGAATVPEN